MQAVILAGGRGTRLQPLTSGTPKPMAKLFGKPVLEHTINLLRRHNIRDLIITVSYKAEQIMDYFGDGSKWDVRILYSLEDMPRGTAGGLRTLQPLLRDTFMVVSGDSVTDFDLTSAIENHKSRSAIATILTYEMDDPTAFGVVDTWSDGRIRRFQEKPSRNEAFSNTINAGVYILEPEVISYIPFDAVYDFSKNVFPRLLQNQEPFFAYRAEGYWCDMGSLVQYRRVHFDALTGKVRLDLPSPQVAKGIWIGEGANIHPTVKLMKPLFVGNDVQVQRKAALGRFAVIGSNSIVGEESHVTHSIMDSRVTIGRDAGIYGSIVGAKYELSDSRKLIDEVVVHDGSNTGLRAEIDQRLLTQCVIEEPLYTWSAFEATRVIEQFTSQQQTVLAA